MTTNNESSEIAVLRRCFEAMSDGDFTLLEQALARDAIWRAVDDQPADCEGRETIIEVMSRNLDGRVRGSIEELVQYGSRVLAGFRPKRPPDPPRRPLEDGVAYMVVTFDDGRITELKGCRDRAAALAYAQTGPPR